MIQLRSALKYAALAVVLLFAAPVGGEETEEEIKEYNAQTYIKEPIVTKPLDNSGFFKIPTRPKEDHRKNTMLPPISAEAKMRAVQSGMLMNPFSLRDMMNFMVAKKKVVPGITFDEVIQSIKTKANELNMKSVGHNTPYKVLRDVYDPKSPRVEILSFCDLITMRKMLDYSLEFLAFLPCKISVAEDADGQIWLVTIDWDVRWLDTSPNPNQIPPEIRTMAISVRERIEQIMETAASGDF